MIFKNVFEEIIAPNVFLARQNVDLQNINKNGF